jgi:Na+(H+)/acetate symporter ActP
MKSIKTLCLTIFFLIFGHIVGSTMKPIVAMQEAASQPSFNGRLLLEKQQQKEIDHRAFHKKRIVSYCFFFLLGLGFAAMPFVLGFFTVGKFLLSVFCIILALLGLSLSIYGINGHLKLLKQEN